MTTRRILMTSAAVLSLAVMLPISATYADGIAEAQVPLVAWHAAP